MADPISFLCPNCNKEVEAEADYAGASLPCPFCEQSVVVPFLGLLPGRMVGPFQLEKRIGCGGMGEVWLAHHSTLDRHVALKILSPTLTKDASFVERFMKESRMAAKIEHPNIITAYDAGFDQGVYFLATSFVEGNDLEHKLKTDGRLSEQKALEITRDVALALQDAWNKNKILHRDIKPANIMLAQDGSTKLMDMGLAKCFDEAISMTMTGTVMGTPHYMSPEQARGDSDIDFRTDIYSLGATLYHTITGIVPFDAETAMGVLSKHLTEPLKDPKQVYEGISVQAAELISIMMNKDRDHRQCCWEEVMEDIDSVMKGEFPIKSPKRQKKFSKKPLIILAAAVVLLFVLLGAFLVIRKIRRNRNNKQTQVAKVENQAQNPQQKQQQPDVQVAGNKVERVEPDQAVKKTPSVTPRHTESQSSTEEYRRPKKKKSKKAKRTDPKRKEIEDSLESIIKRTGFDLAELKKSKTEFEKFKEKRYTPTQVRLLFQALKEFHDNYPEVPDVLTYQEREILRALHDAARQSAKKRFQDFRDRRREGGPPARRDFRSGNGDRRPPR